VNRFHSFLFGGTSLALIAGTTVAADPIANSLTIYSSAQPGAIFARAVSKRWAWRCRDPGLCRRPSRAENGSESRQERRAILGRRRPDRSDHGVVFVA